MNFENGSQEIRDDAAHDGFAALEFSSLDTTGQPFATRSSRVLITARPGRSVVSRHSAESMTYRVDDLLGVPLGETTISAR